MFEVIAVIASVIFGVAAQPVLRHFWHIFKGFILHPSQRGETMKGIKASKAGTATSIITMAVCLIVIVFSLMESNELEDKRTSDIIDAINNASANQTEVILEAIQQIGGRNGE